MNRWIVAGVALIGYDAWQNAQLTTGGDGSAAAPFTVTTRSPLLTLAGFALVLVGVAQGERR